MFWSTLSPRTHIVMQDNIERWLNMDRSDLSYQIISHEEIEKTITKEDEKDDEQLYAKLMDLRTIIRTSLSHRVFHIRQLMCCRIMNISGSLDL